MTPGRARAFLRDLFPDDADRIEATVPALVADCRPRSLAAHREQAGVTQTDLADRLRTTPDEIARIEAAVPMDLTLQELTAYVEALGGDLRVIADWGDTRARLY